MSTHTRLILCITCIVLLVIAGISAGCTAPPPPESSTAGTDTVVIMKDFAFSPATLTVKTGTVVTWLNQDGVLHTVVSDPGSTEAFSSGTLSNGATYTFTFSQAGTYPYHCSIHPSMKGTIIVQS